VQTNPAASIPSAWRVSRTATGACAGGLADLGWDPAADPGTGGAVGAVEAAGFNYKDALACACHPGVMRVSPLVPGIDVTGRLLRAAGGWAADTAVVVTGNTMGESRDGGFATHVRMPVEAVLPRPAALGAADAMALGTAGLTALAACTRLEGLVEDRAGDWLVTGASGGVGMLAVARLAEAGHRVVACSRKEAARETLLGLGAAEVAAPGAVVAAPGKSLAKARWSGVVDTVGGPLLADLLRSVRGGGAVAAIGMAGGADLVTTVHPFILRGITLAGIDAATQLSQDDRRRLWDDLAGWWPRVRGRFAVTRLRLDEVGAWAERMLRGETVGRAVVVP
jgi:putative YhdH/YhfP family quinone oxidoreductase